VAVYCYGSLLFTIISNEAKETSSSEKAFDDFGGRMPNSYERFGLIWKCIKIIIHANEVGSFKV
jgi:hypothetical protein